MIEESFANEGTTVSKSYGLDETICKKITDSEEPAPIQLTEAEHALLLREFWDADAAMDALIREACYSDMQKKLLDQTMYEYIKECAARLFRQHWFDCCAHAGIEEGDVINELFLAYYKLDLNKAAKKPHPKRYICCMLSNRRDRLYSDEKSLLPVITKANSRYRKIYKAVMAGNTQDINFDELDDQTKEVAARVANQLGTAPVSLNQFYVIDSDSVMQEQSPSRNVLDRNAERPYDDVLNHQMCTDLTTSLFNDPAAREVFVYTFLYNSNKKMCYTERIAFGAQKMEEIYNMPYSEYKTYLAAINRYLKAHHDSVKGLIYGEAV